jgi:hypothetical protein
MNIGRRPSVGDGTDVTVEAHILHGFAAADFRGRTLRVVVSGFIRCFPALLLGLTLWHPSCGHLTCSA